MTDGQNLNANRRLRRILPRNLLHELNFDNVIRFFKFILFNFQEWLKNKSIALIFQNIAANLP